MFLSPGFINMSYLSLFFVLFSSDILKEIKHVYIFDILHPLTVITIMNSVFTIAMQRLYTE